MSCAGYACTDQGCLTTCASVADCVSGYDCSSGSCIPQVGGAAESNKCSDDRLSVLGADGAVVQPCSPYLCTSAQCGTSCSATSECVDGFTCNPSDSKCEKVATGSSDSGCGCRAAGGSSRPPLTGFVLLGLLALARRRAFRRRRLYS